ncbi:toll/interleukin-1 receptor domain-containing protein [Actinomadura sp. K4S16]|uniref:tetratricopeptide repeat protein n=1 Tax=Actinomadura sp. K4S16 TaxID=1316147 RepID=UPI0011EEDCCB|nr:toll/interleukin-1 receptor domain-containing protein [Actinomadura sp. K4S16]
MPDTDGYDVFFCYSWKDKRTADALVEALKAQQVDGRPLRVFQDDKEMADYDPITPTVNAALARSRCLVVLYSENLPSSAYCRFEMRYSLSAAHRLDGTSQRVMAIPWNIEYERIRPGRLGDLRLPSPRGVNPAELAASVVARVAKTDACVFGDAPSPPEPDWQPSPLVGTREHFGRDIELWEVHDALHGHQDPGMGGAPVARIVGLGGQGKTMLAEYYARQFAADYPGGVFVLRGFGSHLAEKADRHHVRARRADQVADFAHRLDLDVRGLDTAAIDRAFRAHLASTGRPYLWIVDDLPAAVDRDTFLTLLAPTLDGHTLMTTRYLPADYGCPWGGEVRLDGLDAGAALGLLTSKRPARDARERRDALALAERLGMHPLALAVAAGLAARSDQGGFSGLLAAIERPGPDVLELGERLWGELPTGHRASIAATMLRSVDRLSGPGREVLRAASLMAPTPIPRPLIEGVLARSDGTGEPAARDLVTAGTADAVGCSLAAVVPSGGTALLSVHAMVSRTLRFADIDHTRRALLQAEAVNELTDRIEGSKTTYVHRALVDYLPHVHEVAGALADEDEWHLFNETGRVHAELGDGRAALTCYERLYRACSAALGAGHRTTLTVLAGLGIAYDLVGDHGTALAYKRRAYEGLAALFGPDDLDVLIAYNNVAVSHHELGAYDTARRIYGEVYRARRRLLNVQHPDTLAALSNYAIATGNAGDHRLALRLKRIVHERCRVVHGDDHPATLDALNNLAASLNALNDKAQAHDILTAVYEARRRVLGEDHADTLTARKNMVMTAEAPERLLPDLEVVYRLRLEKLGPGHPETVHTLRNLLELSLPREAVTAAHRRIDLGDDEADVLVATLLALELHESRVREFGADDVRSLVACCFLAHATALQAAGPGALPLISDAVAGLVEELGGGDPRVGAAALLHDWIAVVEDGEDLAE